MPTKIQWAQETWNPVTGCTKISEGCLNCYAERMAKRFWDRPFSKVMCHEDRLDQPSHWRNPRRIFVCSMSDLFHPDVPEDFIFAVFNKMMLTGWHTYIVLTKRPERMAKFCNSRYFKPPIPNIWLGVTAENQARADERIPILLETPAAVHFVSVEPMFEPIDLWGGLDWVICGCESGPGARPFDEAWARDLKEQCEVSGVPFFYKQGRVEGKLVKMPELDGRVWDQYPEVN